MDIEWVGGHHSHYGFQYLRDACPCATCDEEREKTGRTIGAVPATAPGALPMYREPARPAEVSPVGSYAISFVWNDGHNSGIYTWEFLREWCACAECVTARTAAITEPNRHA